MRSSPPQLREETPPRQLVFTSIGDALREARTPLDLPANDDLDEMKEDLPYLVRGLLDTFSESLKAKPGKKEGTSDASEPDREKAWTRWQNAAVDKITKEQENYSSPAEAEKELERNCWLLIREVIDLHEHGRPLHVTKVNEEMRCSERLGIICDMCSGYAIARLDLVKFNPKAVAAWVADPVSYMMAKVNNLWSNNQRKIRTNKSKIDREETEAAQRAKEADGMEEKAEEEEAEREEAEE